MTHPQEAVEAAKNVIVKYANKLVFSGASMTADDAMADLDADARALLDRIAPLLIAAGRERERRAMVSNDLMDASLASEIDSLAAAIRERAKA